MIIISLPLLFQFLLCNISTKEKRKINMTKDRKSPITLDVIRRASSEKMRNRGANRHNTNRRGEIFVEVRWGNKTYSTQITNEEIQSAFGYALEKDAKIDRHSKKI